MPTSIRRRHDWPRSRRRQGGVIVLMVLLIAMTAAMAVMLHGLNAAAGRRDGERRATQDALASAKQALLGYAVAYADGTHALDKGPGHLPCPDLVGGNAPGVAEAECRASSARETGRLPFRTLGLPDLRDGTGAPLWYAVSDTFRPQSTTAINSDTAGTLFVDTQSDIVAVIVAPGAALTAQSRSSGDAYNASAWLEDQNASAGDNHFVSRANGEFNDTVAFITRSELMAAVEPVVLREVANALVSYFHDPDADDDSTDQDPECGTGPVNCDEGFPWPVPMGAILLGSYEGKVVDFATGGIAFGRLPLTRLNVNFDTDFSAAWNVAASGLVFAQGVSPTATPPTSACFEKTACSEQFGPTPTSPPTVFPSEVRGKAGSGWGQGRCRVSRVSAPPPAQSGARLLTLACTNSYTFASNGHTLRRDYALTFSGNLRLMASSKTARRTLAVLPPASWPGGAYVDIAITDTDVTAATAIGAAQARYAGGTSADTFSFTNMPFELEVSDVQAVDRVHSPGALPNWFVANNWHQLVMFQFPCRTSAGHATNADCATTPQAINVTVQHAGETGATTVADVAGVVMTGSARLNLPPPAAAQVRPSPSRQDYLEDLNAIAGGTFLVRDPTATFNDRLLLLRP